ncbi:MAG TPA: FHA domain-containing protein [Propionibacteriaceae bacterium]|nr:FHA domain-containing protein [Propionibacteriaceae bacterium]
MADLIVTLLKVAFLAVLWLFVLIVANVIRGDLFRTETVTSSAGAAVQRESQAPVRARKRGRGEPRVLAIDTGPQAGTRLALVDQFRIGRAPDCALILDDDYVSGDHASLERHPDGRWVLTDLGSTNGTFVNEVRVTGPTVVTTTDSLRIGRTQMRLET